MWGRRFARIATTVLVAGGLEGACSIDETQSLGQNCLQDRECVEGLVCLAQSDGRYACTALPEAGPPPAIDAATDSGSSDSASDGE